MTKDFYSTKEYKTFVKINERIKEFCSLKNMCLYAKYLEKCVVLAEKEYKYIGLEWWMPELNTDMIFEQYDEKELDNLFLKHGTNFDAMVKELNDGIND